MKKQRMTYASVFLLILMIEVLIALFVDDRFIRPYIGDVLVTALLCSLCRVIWPKGIPALPIYVFIFAALVEVAQYINLVKLLGLENNAFFSTIMGTTFSYIDLVCYAAGCILFWAAEKAVLCFVHYQQQKIPKNS